MKADTDMRRSGPLGTRSLDIVVILLAVGGSRVVLLLDPGSPLRTGMALAYLLFFPGYALTIAAFPAGEGVDREANDIEYPLEPPGVPSLGNVERLAVAFGLSVAIVPLLGLALTVLQGGISARSAIDGVTLVVLGASAVGVIRRSRLPEGTIPGDPLLNWLGTIRASVFTSSPVDAFLNVGLALVVLGAMATLAFVLVAPQDGSTYTSMSLLTRGEDGQLVATGYPTEFDRGEGKSLVFSVENRERRPMRYTVVIQLQRVDDGRVVEREELDRFDREVPAEGTWQVRHTVAPTLTGDRLRLTYLLYTDTPPERPRRSNAYRSLYIWITVSP